jgi:hypothetical protein
MANYLLRYKGTYRVKCPYDTETNTFARKIDETLEDIDLYIPCAKGTQITHYGQSTLQVWIPSAVRGRNTINDIEAEIGKGIVFDVRDNETEMLFKFHSKHMEALAKYLKPQTGGCDISPFSVRNLPSNTYNIPKNELDEYKKITKDIPKTELFLIAHATKNFIKSLDKKKNGYDLHLSEMKLKGLKGKEYIHSIGNWDKYINYLKNQLKVGG